MKNIAILVLAAGKSSRMKRIKQLEKINNKTLLDITLEKVKEVFLKIFFVLLAQMLIKSKQKLLPKIFNLSTILISEMD